MWCCHVPVALTWMGFRASSGAAVLRCAAPPPPESARPAAEAGAGWELPRWLLLEAQNRAAGCSGQRL